MSHRISYVVSRWGEPSQTFVRREAAAMQELGWNVEALSLKTPRPCSPAIAVHHLPLAMVAAGILRSSLRSPGGVISVIWAVLRSSTHRTVVRRFAAALTGIAWVGCGTLRGDVIHAHFGWVAATAAWAASEVSGTPYTVVLHAFEIHTAALQDRFSCVALRNASRVFVISEIDRQHVEDRWGVRATVLRMGVPRSWLDRPPPIDGRAGIVAVGSLVPKKGHDVLIRSLTHCNEIWTLQIVGEGPERARLEALVDEGALGSRVRFLGWKDALEVRGLFDEARIAALACVVEQDGNRDGIPVALMEAMSRGTPVVSTDVGAIRELVEGVGTIVGPDDVQALAVALDALADDDLWNERSTACRARVEASFVADKSAEVLSELLMETTRGTS